MKYALIQSSFVLQVDNEEEGAMVAVEGDKANRLQLASLLEQRGLSDDALDGKFAYLGTSVSIFEVDGEAYNS